MARVFWISFVAAMAVYLTMVLWSLPLVADAAGGLAPFDLRPTGYSYEEAIEFLRALSGEGRQFYGNVQLRLDILYPALLALTLVLGFQIAFARPWSTILGLVALVGAATDYLENYMVTVMLATPVEEVSDNIVGIASFWTASKSIATTIALCALLFGMGRILIRRWRL